MWVASANGRIVRVTGISGGLAELDVDGNGTADTGPALVALGVTTEELQTVGATFAVGQSLARTVHSHFTPWDANSTTPVPPGTHQSPFVRKALAWMMSDPCYRPGSVIQCQNGILGETLALSGTGLAMGYVSDRQSGRQDEDNVVLSITGPQVDPTLFQIYGTVETAGQKTYFNVLPLPNQDYTYTWNNRDRWGRETQGIQKAIFTFYYAFKFPSTAAPATTAPPVPAFGRTWEEVGNPAVSRGGTRDNPILILEFSQYPSKRSIVRS